jgi:hypothetical protein
VDVGVIVVTVPGTNVAGLVGFVLTRGFRIVRDDDAVLRRQLVLLDP